MSSLAPPALNPIEAYEELMRFAAKFGEGPLLLAFHAAVPQGFNLDLLHLIKRNFVPEAKDEPATEADLLLSPLCKEMGRGYFQFDSNVRHLLLDNLAESYESEPVSRIQRVANFLLWYTEHFNRLTSGSSDRLWREYLETQRWVALAFIDPENAARQFAECLQDTTAEENVVTRLQLGGLAASLAAPLAGYSHLLNYASALQSLETLGPDETIEKYGDFLNREITVGDLKLRPASSFIPEEYKPTVPEEEIPVPRSRRKSRKRPSIFISHSVKDKVFVRRLAREFETHGVDVWLDEREMRIGDSLFGRIEDTIGKADYLAVVLSANSVNSKWTRAEIKAGLAREVEGSLRVIPVLIDDVEIPLFLMDKLYADFRQEANFESSFEALLRAIKGRSDAETPATASKTGREHDLKKIVDILSFLETSISLRNNIYAEYFYADLLNLVFDLELKNVSAVAKNTPYIELIDQGRKVAFQVTSQNEKAKIDKTLEGFFANPEFDGYKLRFLVIGKDAKDYRKDFTIGGKYEFDANEDVIDFKRLLARISDLKTDRIKKIAEYLEDGAADLRREPASKKFYPDLFLPDLKFFVGREDLLGKIKQTLKEHHRAAIYDISGLGKTFAVYKFVEDNQQNYDKIFFIRATKEEWLESLARCGEMVDPILADVIDQAVKARGFKDWLERDNDWLVIYDNVDQPEELFPYIPINPNGDCIFTSNISEVASLGSGVSITKLDRTDAGILLYSRANNKPYSTPDLEGAEREAFEKILDEIDGLPLTLNSVGALINEHQLLFEEFLLKYENLSEIAWDSEDPFSSYQNKSAGKVFSLAYDELSSTEIVGEAVRIILNAVSFLAPDEIPAHLLKDILENSFEPFARATDPDNFWDKVRKSLTTYEMLKYDRQKKVFSTHRSVQQVIQSRLKGNEKDTCVSLAIVLNRQFPLYDYSNREVCEKYYQHVLTLLENAEKFGAETEKINELYFKLGRFQSGAGNYTLAERFHFRAAEISANVSGADSERHAADLNDLAVVYSHQGRYEDAIQKYEEALRINEKTIGRGHPEYARNLSNLGYVLQSQGRYEEAIQKYEEALRINEKTLGREHPDYSANLGSLGRVLQSQGKYDEARKLYEQALQIDERIFGPKHPIYAKNLNSLGQIYRLQFRYDEATEQFEKALQIYEMVGLKEYPDYALALSNKALVDEAREKYPESLELFEQALQIFETKLPAEHPYITEGRKNVARCRAKLQGPFESGGVGFKTDGRLPEVAAMPEFSSMQFEDINRLHLDHPGANDNEYRARRDYIAGLAKKFRETGVITDVDYTGEEQGVWRHVAKRLDKIQLRRVSKIYLKAKKELGISNESIPRLSEMNRRLQELSNFRLAPIEGLVETRAFLSWLSYRTMLSTQYIRHHSRPEYTPEPDIVHECLGHIPMLTNRDYVDFLQFVGHAARVATDEQIDELSRLYWFTAEFGLIEEDGEPTAYGAGLLSSAGELEHAFSDKAERRPFDLERVINTSYDYSDMQAILYVIPSFAELKETARKYVEKFEHGEMPTE